MNRREEYVQAINDSFEAYKSKILTYDKNKIFELSWEIAKYIGITNFLRDWEPIWEDERYQDYLYEHRDTIIDELREYEMEYDTPQWCNWDNLEEMLHSYILGGED